MQRTSIAYLISLSLLVSLISCQNNQVPIGQRFRIKKVTKQGDQQLSTDTYNYDGEGRLNNIYKTYTQRSKGSNRDYYYTTLFQYNAQGKLSSIIYQPDDKAPGTIKPSRYDYLYDVNGTITTIRNFYISPDTANNRTFNLVYNGNKFPVKISSINDAFKDGYTTEYTYNNGNVAEIKTSNFNNTGEVTSSLTRTYQFDAKPNPFYNLYTGAPDSELFNDNAFKLNTFYQSNTFNENNILYPDATYEYDANGNLIKITSFVTTTLEYEVY